LRIENAEQLFFVTSRTLDRVFWLHLLLCSELAPANREARRVLEAKRSRLDARLSRMVNHANQRALPNSLSSRWRKRSFLRTLISSALARAQKACEEDRASVPEVCAVLVMSNHVHLVVRTPGKIHARLLRVQESVFGMPDG
jgi:hypothetical protein